MLISQLNKFDGKRTVKGSRWQDESEMARAPLPSTHMDKMAGNIMVGDGINKNASREKQRLEQFLHAFLLTMHSLGSKLKSEGKKHRRKKSALLPWMLLVKDRKRAGSHLRIKWSKRRKLVW